jgi:hypothetical protein
MKITNYRSGPLPNLENVADGPRLFDGYDGYGEDIIVTRQGTLVRMVVASSNNTHSFQKQQARLRIKQGQLILWAIKRLFDSPFLSLKRSKMGL